MKHPDNFYNLLMVVEELSNSIFTKIDDYEKHIYENQTLKKDFHNIDFVYMHSIILDMGKLLSVTGNDRSGLTELENISTSEFKTRILSLRESYKDVINKITTNRNKIIAHVDVSDFGSYFKLGFSKTEVDRMIDSYKEYVKLLGKKLNDADMQTIKNYEELKSTSVKYERYSPSDFFEEKGVFKKIVKEVLEIARDLNYYFYNLK